MTWEPVATTAEYTERTRLVEDALLKTALGYTAEDEQLESVIDPETGKPVNHCKRKVCRSDVPGNLRAQIFWLINCGEGKWKEHPEKFFQNENSGLADGTPFSESELEM